MTELLHDAAPDFDQPIAVLKHCHGKIRKQLSTLQNLPGHLAQQGVTIEAQQAASAVLKYFNKAAPLHHDDEERDLMPMLQATAQGEDAALLNKLVPEIHQDHRHMDLAWAELKVQLDAIADGSAAVLDKEQVRQFADAYASHMTKEETQIAPMALRLFSTAQMAQLGAAMKRRRGVADQAGGHAFSQTLPPPTGAIATGPTTSLADLRTDYSQASLLETDVLGDPIAQFGKWFDEALKAQVNEPNAMSVATVGTDGKPSSRIVLIKQFDQRGFTWYTNYSSQKGEQLAANPHAALLFFWSELERQVRIEGRVVKTSEVESDHYFNSRPLKSRLAAIASAQSAVIGSREALEANYEAVAAQYGEHPSRPSHWGGYRLVPERIEFWQGRRSRFHDRIVFTLQEDGSWQRQRLQP
jgi:pyridoxamine 5'-phosphate oxidase